MRVIYRSDPLPAKNVQPPNNALVDGTAYCEVILLEPGDAIRPNMPSASYWRSQASGGRLRVRASSKLVGVPEAFVPSSVFNGLPDNAPVLVTWSWTIKGQGHTP